MVQPLNHAINRVESEKKPYLNDYQRFITHIMQLLQAKQLVLPLNIEQLQKIMKIDLNQLSDYLQTVSSTFKLFSIVNQSETMESGSKLFPQATSRETKSNKSHPSSQNEYHLTRDELKIIADLYYFSSLRPLPMENIKTNVIYKAILEKFPRFFQIANETLQLTLCAKCFTEEFLRCKKIKVEMANSMVIEEKGQKISFFLD